MNLLLPTTPSLYSTTTTSSTYIKVWICYWYIIDINRCNMESLINSGFHYRSVWKEIKVVFLSLEINDCLRMRNSINKPISGFNVLFLSLFFPSKCPLFSSRDYTFNFNFILMSFYWVLKLYGCVFFLWTISCITDTFSFRISLKTYTEHQTQFDANAIETTEKYYDYSFYFVTLLLFLFCLPTS